MPPSTLSSTRSAKRRSSSRARPGAPRHTWYCSVSLVTKRTVPAWGDGAAGACGRDRAAALGAGAADHLDELVVVDASPRRTTTTFEGT